MAMHDTACWGPTLPSAIVGHKKRPLADQHVRRTSQGSLKRRSPVADSHESQYLPAHCPCEAREGDVPGYALYKNPVSPKARPQKGMMRVLRVQGIRFDPLRPQVQGSKA